MREAADAGHVGAMEQLGRICLEATPPDVACAQARLERAAREGRLSATTLLGWMQAEGIGGKADPARAARYYREAAGKGDATARNNLGELYERGRGVEQDPAKAFDHYLLAALAGFPPAQFNLGRLLRDRQGHRPGTSSKPGAGWAKRPRRGLPRRGSCSTTSTRKRRQTRTGPQPRKHAAR
jgi:TPR repeat protein